MRRIATNVAEASGATATLELMPAPNPPVVNDPALTERVTRSLKRALGDDAVTTSRMLTVGEDFAYIARAVPSVYWWVGITPAGTDPAAAPDNHSEHFYVDEAGIQVGAAQPPARRGRLPAGRNVPRSTAGRPPRSSL